MSRDINSIIIIGRVIKDAEYQELITLLKFSVAVNSHHIKEKNVPSFFDVNLWGKYADALHKYIKKGVQLSIQGRLKQERWEKDGQKRSRVIIQADNLQLLGKPQTNNTAPQDHTPSIPSTGQQQEFPQNAGPGNDEIPF